ncbi:MAG: protein kinase, partial [Acidobacteriota bacterium]
MTPERWRFVRQLFDDALELPPKARPAFVEERCGDDAEARILVTSMLAEHGAGGGPMDHPLIHLGEGGMEAPEDGGGGDLPGRLGVYDCLRRIGRGGMGTVYLGVRADDAYRQEVAIKVLRKGLDTEDLVRRFRRERQILASLDHPNIAKLLDGGSTRDGRPYLVMEHVDGEPVDRYCDDRRLSVEDRLRLFGKVCAAVQSAHRKLVVHRDLKPANILVSVAGEPKLLDFGVAKLLDPEGFPESVAATREGPAPLTPEYASPEQLRGETISTASDVYSLGVVLHLLLCGRGPDFGAADPRDSAGSEAARPSTLVRVSTSTFDPAAAARARGLDPPRLARSLAGDLDNVVRRALHPEPDRRYPSVSELAQDLEWHLTDRPVAARPDTLGYRAGKFLRRRTLAVATSTLAVVFLVGWGVSLQIGRIELERQIRRAEAASGFLEDVFEVSDPTRALGESITAREVLDRGVEQIDAELGSQPDLRADLKEPMARSYKNLGLYDEAEALLRDVLDQRLRRHGENHPEVVAVLLELAEVEELRGELDSAEGLALKAQGTSRRLLGERSGPHVESLLRLAKIHTEQGRRADAAAELERAIDLAQDADLPELLASGVDDRAELQLGGGVGAASLLGVDLGQPQQAL